MTPTNRRGFLRHADQQYSQSMDQRSSGSTPWWVQSHHNPPTPDERRLLERVEELFAAESAGLSEWDDPHYDPSAPGERRDAKEEEYSQCLDPQKYRIVLARADAWTMVLTELGWAEAQDTSGAFDTPDSPIEWALFPWSSPASGHMAVLRPHAEGAVPLTFWTVDAAEDTAASVSIGAGDPAVFLEQMPDCCCDACDSGSEDMFRVIDETVLSVVGGSLIVELNKKWLSVQSGTGSSAGGPDSRFRQTTSFHASPWSDSWDPRPVFEPPVPEPIGPPRRGPGVSRLARDFRFMPRRYAAYVDDQPSGALLRRKKRG